jgi:hypothetical protein
MFPEHTPYRNTALRIQSANLNRLRHASDAEHVSGNAHRHVLLHLNFEHALNAVFITRSRRS